MNHPACRTVIFSGKACEIRLRAERKAGQLLAEKARNQGGARKYGSVHLIKKAEFTRKTGRTSAVTLIQRFGSALNLNIHLHMLFLDGVYVDCPDESARFRWVKAPTNTELNRLAHTIARRVGRFLEREGLLERDAENSYLAAPAMDEGPMDQLRSHSITYRIAVAHRRAAISSRRRSAKACPASVASALGTARPM